MAWTEGITPEDDLLHPHDDDPYWNESTFFSFSVPERGVLGFIYYYFRPNMNMVVGGPGIIDETGDDMYNCLYWGWDAHLPIPPGAQMYDVSLPNGLTVTTIDLLRRYRFTYVSEHCTFDLEWQGVESPFNLQTTSDGQLNEGMVEWVTDAPAYPVGHYEQAGWMTGTVTVRGQTLRVDCGSVRDRSWGPRPLRSPPRFGYVFGCQSAANSFQINNISDLPVDEDPIFGTVERAVSGWYTRDGVRSAIVSGTRRCERAVSGRPVREIVHAIDELGRTLHVEGEATTQVKFPMYGTWVDRWCLVRWQHDGAEVWGESHDVMTFEHFRRFPSGPHSAPS